MTQRIDAHQHFWRPARGDYGWLDPRDPGLAPLYRDVEPAELLPLLQAHGVGHTVLVQAAPSEAETAAMTVPLGMPCWILSWSATERVRPRSTASIVVISLPSMAAGRPMICGGRDGTTPGPP